MEHVRQEEAFRWARRRPSWVLRRHRDAVRALTACPTQDTVYRYRAAVRVLQVRTDRRARRRVLIPGMTPPW